MNRLKTAQTRLTKTLSKAAIASHKYGISK
jgi:hypothetical protein